MLTAAYLLIGWCSPLRNPLRKGKRQIAKIQIKEIEGALKLFHFDMGRFPTTAEGLGALIRNPGNSPRWMGPYSGKPEILKDPWGRPYHYRFPGDHGDYDLYSLGADGTEGGDGDNADITSWETENSRR